MSICGLLRFLGSLDHIHGKLSLRLKSHSLCCIIWIACQVLLIFTGPKRMILGPDLKLFVRMSEKAFV